MAGVSSLLHEVGTPTGKAAPKGVVGIGSDLAAGAVAAADVASDLFDRAMDSLGEAFAELGDAFSGSARRHRQTVSRPPPGLQTSLTVGRRFQDSPTACWAPATPRRPSRGRTARRGR